MSDLQLGLIAIGAAVLAAVIAYNKWQEAKLRSRSEESFASHHRDVLLAGDADAVSQPATTAGPDPHARAASIEHTLGREQAGIASHRGPGGILDPAADFIVEIQLDELTSGVRIAAAIAANMSPGSHPIYWEGLNPSSEAWETGAESRRYDAIRIGLQLVARIGAVTDLDLATFCAGAQEVAAQIGGIAALDDLDEARARAQALDRFCADVDVQLRFNLVGRDGGALAVARVCTVAETAGCTAEDDGCLHYRDDEGAEVFAIADAAGAGFADRAERNATLREVALLLDVPRAPAGPDSFRRFVDFAREMERSLGARLVDDNRQPLTDAGIARIGNDLAAIHARMAAKGIAAGSPLAQRVFS